MPLTLRIIYSSFSCSLTCQIFVLLVSLRLFWVASLVSSKWFEIFYNLTPSQVGLWFCSLLNCFFLSWLDATNAVWKSPFFKRVDFLSSFLTSDLKFSLKESPQLHTSRCKFENTIELSQVFSLRNLWSLIPVGWTFLLFFKGLKYRFTLKQFPITTKFQLKRLTFLLLVL